MLNNKQKKFIPLLIVTGSVEQACQGADVGKTTYYTWLKDKEFSKELKKQQDSVYSSSLIDLKNLFTKAVETYSSLLNSDDESVKFRTAKAIIYDMTRLVQAKELKDRLEMLEDTVYNKNLSDCG